jgi:hypothetical protein
MKYESCRKEDESNCIFAYRGGKNNVIVDTIMISKVKKKMVGGGTKFLIAFDEIINIVKIKLEVPKITNKP